MTYVPKIGDVAVARDGGVEFECCVVGRDQDGLWVVDVLGEVPFRTHRAQGSSEEVRSHFDGSPTAYFLMSDDFVRLARDAQLRRRRESRRSPIPSELGGPHE